MYRLRGIITLNAAHYTVWLYRASTLFALNSSIPDELAWLNDIALDNQKNYSDLASSPTSHRQHISTISSVLKHSKI